MRFKTDLMNIFGCHRLTIISKSGITRAFFLCVTLLLTHSSAQGHLNFPFFPDRGKFNQESAIEKAYRLKTVVIDAGHGGRDPGCSGADSKEKEITLAIAKNLAFLIRDQYPELKIVMTRDDDTFIPLHERAAMANRAQADLFISIHCNTMPPSPKAAGIYGTETYVMGLHTAGHNLEVAKRENASILLESDYQQHYDYDPDSPEGHILLSMFQNAYLDQSIRLAEIVEQQFEQSGRKSRGVKQAGFVVLKSTAMPSILIESGFLSNTSEESFLRQSAGQQQIARAILEAFSLYKSEIEGFPAPAKPLAVAAPQAPAVPPAEVPAASLWFQIQLAASKKELSTDHFFAIRQEYALETSREEGYYKYRTRKYPTLAEAEQARYTLRAAGYPDAFIVAFRNGQKISLDAAKKLSGE